MNETESKTFGKSDEYKRKRCFVVFQKKQKRRTLINNKVAAESRRKEV